jgi:hypothetical protein
MSTTHERTRWKEQILRDHPYMNQLPGAVDMLIDMYCSDKKGFDQMVRECKAVKDDPNRKSTVLPEVITYGLRKGEPEEDPLRTTEDGDTRISITELPAEHLVSGESQPSDDPGQQAENPDT